MRGDGVGRRLRAIHRRMTWSAFEQLPRRVGWKHEYYGGKAHITPSKLVVQTALQLRPRNERPRSAIRAATAGDAEALEWPFLRAFARTPEYADYSWAHYQTSAAKYLAGFFGDARGKWSAASAVAVLRGSIIGAALIKEARNGPLLDCVFVDPAYERRGWATALAARAANSLRECGAASLRSFIHPANGPSLQWHEKFGFEELPDGWVAAHRWRTYAEQLDRLSRMKRSPRTALAGLTALTTHWFAEAKRLEQLEKQDFWAAHPPID
jgi:L-amino acid N-acyltransferase YncA